MGWNYRIFREEETVAGQTEAVYTIRETYYDDAGRPNRYTVEPAYPSGATIEDLSNDIAWMTAALTLPILGLDLKEAEPAHLLKDDLLAAVEANPESFPAMLRKPSGTA
jgi:hypothetical protein